MKVNKSILFWLGLALVFSLTGLPNPVTATGSQVFASADGLDSDPCTQTVPCSLGQALVTAQNDDTVYMKAGTYLTTATLTKSLTLQGGWSGAATGELVVDSQLFPTIIDGEDARICVRVNSQGINVIIRGLILTHGWASLGGGGVYVQVGNASIEGNIITENYGNSYGGGIYIGDSAAGNSATILSNEITYNTAKYGGGAITIIGDTTRASIVNNLISNNHAVNGTDPGYGSALQLDAADVTVESNRIFQNDGSSAISCNGQTTGICTLINNIIAANRTSGDNQAASIVVDNYRTILKHNTIVDSRWGIRCDYANILEMTNNILADQTAQSISSTNCPGITLSGSHNLFWNNGSNPLTLDDFVIGDPNFRNAMSLDFHLGSGSAAVDAALADPTILDDFEGDLRPINAGSDIGADEQLIYVFLPLIMR
jgi:hypothetical protein